MSILDSLWVRLGFQVDGKDLEKFESLADKAKHTMLGLGASISGAAIGLGLMVEKTAEKMGGVQAFAEQIGITAREVEALGKVASENHSSLEAMESGIQSLTSMTGQAAAGVGRGAMFFKKWHLSAKNADGSTKNFNEILGDVVDKMSSLDRSKRIALGQRLGFDMATIQLMSKGRENFEKLRRAALAGNPLTNENYELAEKTEKLFRKAHSSTALLTKRLAVALMPTVNRMLDTFIKWTKSESNVRRLSSAVETAGRAIEFVWKNLGKVVAMVGVFMTYKLGIYVGDLAGKIASAAKAMGSLTAAGGLLRGLLTGRR